MKLTTKIVEKIGADRLLHFFVCACIVLTGGYFGDLGIFISFCTAVILSVLKEYVFDEREDGNEADYADMLWGFGGAIAGVVWCVAFLLLQN